MAVVKFVLPPVIGTAWFKDIHSVLTIVHGKVVYDDLDHEDGAGTNRFRCERPSLTGGSFDEQ